MKTTIKYAGQKAIVNYSQTQDGTLVLVSVLTDQSKLLQSDMIGAGFPDLVALRNAVQSRLRAIAKNAPQITTLDKVNISREAYDAWMKIIAEVVATQPAVNADDIEDETATILDGGELRISVEVDGKTYSYDISPDQWAWI